MLTKQDLKNIGDLIDSKLEEKLESKLEEKLESKFEEKLAPIYKEIKLIKKDTASIRKVIEKDFGFHEKQNMHVIKNVQVIQRHLGIPIMTIEPLINNF
jgi:hypothetical protein